MVSGSGQWRWPSESNERREEGMHSISEIRKERRKGEHGESIKYRALAQCSTSLVPLPCQRSSCP
eukprot:103264-Hanusia_phi.AAC.3